MTHIGRWSIPPPLTIWTSLFSMIFSVCSTQVVDVMKNLADSIYKESIPSRLEASLFSVAFLY